MSKLKIYCVHSYGDIISKVFYFYLRIFSLFDFHNCIARSAATLTRIGKTAWINHKNSVLFFDYRSMGMTIHYDLAVFCLCFLHNPVMIFGHKIIMSMCHQNFIAFQCYLFFLWKICEKVIIPGDNAAWAFCQIY